MFLLTVTDLFAGFLLGTPLLHHLVSKDPDSDQNGEHEQWPADAKNNFNGGAELIRLTHKLANDVQRGWDHCQRQQEWYR